MLGPWSNGPTACWRPRTDEPYAAVCERRDGDAVATGPGAAVGDATGVREILALTATSTGLSSHPPRRMRCKYINGLDVK